MNDRLIDQARALIDRLDVALWDCYEAHPHLGDVPKAGAARRIRKIRNIRQRARGRMNRRLHAAGYPIPICGALGGLINSKDSSWF